MKRLARVVPCLLVVVLTSVTTPDQVRANEGAEAAPSLEYADEHPRLLFRAEDLPRMREAVKANSMARECFRKELESVDSEAEIRYPIPSAHTNREWQPVAYDMSGRAAQCGFLYQMTGDEAYAQWAKKLLLAWAENFDTRVNYKLVDDYHGQEVGKVGEGGNTMGYYFSGGVLMRLSMAYDCLYPYLADEEREMIERDLFGRWVAEIEAYDHSRRQPGYAPDFMTGPGSWNGANMCNMGLTAVGFTLDIPRLYERGIDNFKTVVSRDMLADGFWIEEDRHYADTCMATFFTIAWMARSSGYPTDLFHLTVRNKPREEYDLSYIEVMPEPDGPVSDERSLKMYLDAHLDWQYPNFGKGNWGWRPDSGDLASSRYLVGMYVVGNAVYGDPEYGFILDHVDPTQSGLAPSGIETIYFATSPKQVEPVSTVSRWYPHGKWIVLKSIEGADYWNSDALYAFMPYGHERTKGLEPLSLDLYGFGKVLAPRLTLEGYAQNITKDYQMNEPGWNIVMVDGNNFSIFRERIDSSSVVHHAFEKDIKVVSTELHMLGERRAELTSRNVERHPEEDRTISRTLALTDTYLVDVVRVTYDRQPLYKHYFDYVFHGYGDLSMEGKIGNIAQMEDVTAVWRQEDGIGLRSTILSAGPRGGTKVDRYTDARSAFMVATRANYEEWFVVVHEPFKGESRIASIEKIADQDDAVVLAISLTDGSTDTVALRIKPTESVYRWTGPNGREITLEGNHSYRRE